MPLRINCPRTPDIDYHEAPRNTSRPLCTHGIGAKAEGANGPSWLAMGSAATLAGRSSDQAVPSRCLGDLHGNVVQCTVSFFVGPWCQVSER